MNAIVKTRIGNEFAKTETSLPDSGVDPVPDVCEDSLRVTKT